MATRKQKIAGGKAQMERELKAKKKLGKAKKNAVNIAFKHEKIKAFKRAQKQNKGR